MPSCSRPQPSVLIVSGVIVLITASILLASSFIAPPYLKSKLNEGIRDVLVIDSPHSSSYNAWLNNTKKDDVPLYFSFYAFNITNPDEVIEGTAKPNLVEMGPYVYREYKVKFKIDFPDDGDQVTYKTWTFYVLDPAQSQGNPMTDLLTTVNIPFQAVRANLGAQWWQSLAFDVLASSAKSGVFTTRTVNDLLWGYNDTLLEQVAALTGGNMPTSFGLQVNYTTLEHADAATNWDTFHTGKKNIRNILQYTKYQGNSSLSFWGTPEANKVHGTDASQFHPGVHSSELLTVFVDSCFRTAIVNSSPNAKVTIHGVHLQRFTLWPNNMLNASQWPANAAWYQYGPSGVLNFTAPSQAPQGTPIFISKPHFLDADPSYLAAVTGLNPDRSKHETVIDVEPISGTTMNVRKQLQFSVVVDSVPMLYPNLARTYIPVGYLVETSCITESLANEFTAKVYAVPKYSEIIEYTGWTVGGLGVAAGLVLLVVGLQLRRDRHRSHIYKAINDTDDTPPVVFLEEQ